MTSQATLALWEPLRQQASFRQLLDAFSYPGRIAAVDGGQDGALCAVLATLLDASVTLADPDRQFDVGLLALFQARPAEPQQAGFVAARGELPPAFTPRLGTLGSPEGGATLILKVACIGEGETLRLNGPGCDGDVTLRVRGLHAGWLDARAAWNSAFPMGVDLILVDDTQVVALPRTTAVTTQIPKEKQAWAM